MRVHGVCLLQGRVHYHVRARIDSPDDSVRQNKDRVFIILSNLDLNTEPHASVSVLNIILVVNIPYTLIYIVCVCVRWRIQETGDLRP